MRRDVWSTLSSLLVGYYNSTENSNLYFFTIDAANEISGIKLNFNATTKTLSFAEQVTVTNTSTLINNQIEEVALVSKSNDLINFLNFEYSIGQEFEFDSSNLLTIKQKNICGSSTRYMDLTPRLLDQYLNLEFQGDYIDPNDTESPIHKIFRLNCSNQILGPYLESKESKLNLSGVKKSKAKFKYFHDQGIDLYRSYVHSLQRTNKTTQDRANTASVKNTATAEKIALFHNDGPDK